jgi:hypothetical protein
MITIRAFHTPIKIKPVVLANIIALWAAASLIGLYFYPDRNLGSGIIVGFFAMILLMIADLGHAISHIFSARRAGAPMDEILVSSGMPRTIYADNDVPPRVHILRSLGGPIFSVIGLLLSLIVLALASAIPLVRELAAWSVLGHGFILIGSLMPLPIVDGGVILKWTLVQRGMAEEEADRRLRLVNWILGSLAMATGLILLILQPWIAGLILVGAGLFLIVAATGRIR